MIRGSKIVQVLNVVLLNVVLAHAAQAAVDIYISQTGGGSGASCASSKDVTFFNTLSSWQGTGPIVPGTTVHLCGTISSPLMAQASGTASSPITIAFDCPSNGRISMPAIPATGALTVSGLSNMTIDGQGCGIIESTDNGSPAGGYGNRVGSQAILANNANNIEVKNLQCSNLYIHIPPEQTPWGSPYPVCVNFAGPSNNITIDHNIVYNADAALKDILYTYRFVTITTQPQSLTVAPRSGAQTLTVMVWIAETPGVNARRKKIEAVA